MSERWQTADLEKLFPGGGEMARRMREFPWQGSALGPPSSWPKSLLTAVHICLTSRFPIVLWWGKDLRLLYNDAWRPVLGRTKHPAALGSPGREVWPEIWHIIGPMFQSVLEKGEATWSDDQLLPLDRNGYLEEAYFTYSYSPIPDEHGGIGGVFAAVNETTPKVLAERRLRTLRELAAQTLQAKGAVDAARMAMDTLAANSSDVPFALLYLVDGDGQPRLEQSRPAGVESTDGRWPIAEAISTGEPILVDRMQSRVGTLPSPWPSPPQHALVLPLRSAAQGRVLAVLILGVNPARELDEEHRGFLDMAARHIATSVANASAYEEERRRAESLAELDRAKTAFFSNVSHEFRTPLTLMLGPVEDLLAKPAGEAPPQDRAALEVVHRNGQRLLKLVNALLDFARIEAGRAQASYEPTDLAALTADLASNFRSACERAGLRLTVDCPALGEPAYVDREMWEKIVLNLLSNAFKFTLEGEIAVSLRRKGSAFELAVRDSGSGIPQASLPRMFERFHRVEGARGRSHEGSGIGLALTQELVKLHGGSIAVDSVPGKGTTFTVALPMGSGHLPAERVRAQREAASTAARAGAFVDEALSWLPARHEHVPARTGGARVLLADDNADLREYARRLLAEHYDVEPVEDGEAALAAARARKPDLIVTDVMMPRLDGFGLIRELRADESLREVPVIALSARAGEESRIEGLGKGADDYLTKPFSARELLVRVGALLRSTDIRRQAQQALREREERLRAVVETTPECVKVVAADGTLLNMNASGLAMVGAASPEAVVGRCVYDLIAPEDRERFREFNQRICRGERGTLEFDIVGLHGLRRHMETHAAPLREADGSLAQLALTRDITERKRAEEELRESEQRLRLALEAGRMGSWEWHIPTNRVTWSPGLEAIHGLAPGTFAGTFEAYQQDIHPDDRDYVQRCVGQTLEGRDHHIQYRIVLPDGSMRWVEGRGRLFRDERGAAVRVVGVCSDITERKRAEDNLRRSEQELSDFFESAAIGLHWVGPDGIIQRANRAELEMLGYTKDEYVGRHIAEFHADRPVIDDILARLTCGERLNDYPARLRCKDGSIRDVLINSSVLFEDGEFIHTRCFTLDVTERKRAETNLVARARQQQAVASLGELALRERDLQKVFEQATRVVAETLEVEYCKVLELLPGGAEVLLRAGVGWKEGLVGAARVSAGIDSQAGYTLSSDAPVIVKDLRAEPRFSGPLLLFDHGVVSGMSCVIRGPDGAAWGVLGTHSRRQIEFTRDDVSFLTAVANILGHAIQRELAEAALRESDRRKDEFIAMLSHELRNPLAPLRSALELLRMAPAPDLDPGRIHEMMQRQTSHLVRLVDDLLEMSRINRGTLELRRERVSVATVVRNAVETSEPLIREAGHALALDLPAEPVWLDGDPVRLAQVVSNLLNNAARYTPRGGRIVVRAEERSGVARISVRDNGQGFAPEAAPGLFEMFARGERSSGLGVGLALARRLAELHGGSLEARSEGEGKGAEFTIVLPAVARGPGGRSAAAPTRDATRALSHRILVADDNRDAAESLAMVLRALGGEVSIAYDGAEAVEQARMFRPDVAILDIGMPKLNGYDAAKRIRRELGAQRVKIVALTGWGQDEDRRRAREAGFDAHLVKPAEMEALRAMLASLAA